jgi:Fe-S-cluster containining protein
LHPARTELRALYDEVDALLGPFSCPGSTDCCHFGRTGREPYPHAVELAEVEHAARAANVSPTTPAPSPAKPRKLQVLAERRCPLLGADGRCRIYASRPFGCRTYFCDRIEGPTKFPRERVREIGRRVADLSARTFPRDPGPRLLTKGLATQRR